MNPDPQFRSTSSVDVIIPCFNAARFLPAAVESVESQTHPDWHVVLIDDGSRDETAAIAAELRRRLGARLTYVSQQNAGPSAARNNGIRNSGSPFIAMLDADDIWLPERLAAGLEVMIHNPDTGLVFSNVMRVDMAGGRIDEPRPDLRYTQGNMALNIYTRRLHIPCVSTLIRRECIERVGLFDETMWTTEDRDLWLRIAQRYKVRYINRVLAKYRMTDASLSSDPNRILSGQLRFIAKNYHTKHCGWAARRAAMASVYREQASSYIGRNRLRSALVNGAKSMYWHPFERSQGSLLRQLAEKAIWAI